MSKITRAFVVSHTHWDREWYRTSHAFRMRLVDVMRRVLTALEHDDAFEHFLLDGQTVILEDYLSFHPEDERRIRNLVEAQKLAIGPWYVLPDEFLVSAEAHVRNLLIGHQVGGRFGGVQKVGYLPDSFGHIAQMPQILRGAGIDCFVYSRGDGDAIDELGQEYTWEAPDGSAVLAVSQLGGYCRAGAMGLAEGWEATTQREIDVELAVRQVGDILTEMSAASNTDVALISNGCDHLPPQARLGDVLAALRAAFPDTEFVHASLGEYVAAVRAALDSPMTHAGELLGGKRQLSLPGVWSARSYLKQANDRAQTLLSGYFEPLSAYLHFVHGRSYPAGAIHYAWKMLLQNHPHDSICGCSTDAVHREMEPRFAAVSETAEAACAEHLAALAPTFATHADDDRDTIICVANTLPRSRVDVMERLVVLRSPGIDPSRLELVDDRGEPVTCVLVASERGKRTWGVEYRTELFGDRQRAAFASYCAAFPDRLGSNADKHDAVDQYVIVQWLADLPSLGHRIYALREARQAPPPVTGTVAAGGNSIENEFVKVVLHPNGTFDLEDKANAVAYHGLNRLEDSEDIGDEYDYSPAPEPLSVSCDDVEGTVRAVAATPLKATVESVFSLELPREISKSRMRRSDDTVVCPVRVQVTVTQGTPVVDVAVTFDNRARDHRLRAEFRARLGTDAIISDGHFEVVRRAVHRSHANGWVQPAGETSPQQDFSLVEDGRVGLAVLNRGLHEVAPLRSATGQTGFAVTLLRAVGWLSRDDFPTRRYRNAGPMIPTPDAQCSGERVFAYAVMSYAGDYISADVKGWSTAWRVPPVAVQGVADGHVVGGMSLMEVAERRVAVTAVKKHEQRDTLIVRLNNLDDASVHVPIVLGLPVVAAWRTNLLEEREESLVVNASTVAIPLRPHEIATVEIDFAPAATP